MATGKRFMKLLLIEHPELEALDLSLGLPHQGFVGTNEPMDACYVLIWVAEVFGLDLRSQGTVVEMVVAAAAGVPQGKKVFLLWLAVLCAMKHKSPEAFDALATGSLSDRDLNEVWGKTTVVDTDKVFSIRAGQDRGTQTVNLLGVVSHYYKIQNEDLKDIRKRMSEGNMYDYPQSVAIDLAEEMSNTFFPTMVYPDSIRSYFNLVRTAGHLVAI